MRNALAAVGTVAAFASHALGQNGQNRTAAAAPSAGDAQVLIQRERDLLGAYTRGDTAALRRMLADDVTDTAPNGSVSTKRDLLRNAPYYSDMTFDVTGVNVRTSGVAAVVTGVIVGRVRPGGFGWNGEYRFTDTFVRRGDDWQLLATHQSRVPPWQLRDVPDGELAPLAALDCGREPSLRSRNADVAAYVKFTNASARTVLLRWINYQGTRDPAADQIGTLRPGQSRILHTYLTHPFVAADTSGRCLAIYQPALEPSVATVR